MSIELDRPGHGVAAFMLNLGTLLALEKNGMLTGDELLDIVQQSVAKLKAIDAEPSLRSQAVRGRALDLLEKLYARLPEVLSSQRVK